MSQYQFIKALLQQPVDRVPVWFMRQAGRYLPEYREVRKQAGSFVNLCKTPELACEVTLQPLRRFDFDAAILFSDILTVPDAMGLGLEVVESKGPMFARPVRTQHDLSTLRKVEVETDLSYVIKAVMLIVYELADNKPLIGFAGSPWTVATYMVEGQATKSFSLIKKMLYTDPALLHGILESVTKVTIDYLNAQIRSGVSAVMLFDSWGGILSPDTYEAFSLHYLRAIAAGIEQPQDKKVPIIFYGRQTNQHLEQIASSGCDAVGVDWTITLAEARARVGGQVALQGNLDPTVLYADEKIIREKVNEILEQVANQPGFVFNLGHGMLPDIPPESVAIAVDAVHQFKMKY